ncbi:MAG: hypothetical protein NZ704_12395 [Geminicoccaceae bacterium]|nr:hypothetical protein [Geminicoccaceae bacterium]
MLDLPLLLVPFGPWLVQRLAGTGDVWLPRALLRWIEEAEAEIGDAAALSGAALGLRDDEDLAEVLDLWRASWPDLAQEPRIFWFGDSPDRSRPRKGLPAALLDRLDELARGLEPIGASAPPDAFLDAARDALALTAALSRERAVLLTPFLGGRMVPVAVEALDRFGIATHRLEGNDQRRHLVEPLVARLAAARVLGLLACGLVRMGFVELYLPHAPRPLPAARPWPWDAIEEPDELLLTSDDSDRARELWREAVAIWDELR